MKNVNVTNMDNPIYTSGFFDIPIVDEQGKHTYTEDGKINVKRYVINGEALHAATATRLGGVKVGENLTIDENGVLSAAQNQSLANMITRPAIVGDTAVIGRASSFHVSATAGLVGASIVSFTCQLTGCEAQTIPATNGEADVTFTLPASIADETSLTFTCVAHDSYENSSLTSTKTVIAKAVAIVTPTFTVSNDDGRVIQNPTITVTNIFAVSGNEDIDFTDNFDHIVYTVKQGNTVIWTVNSLNYSITVDADLTEGTAYTVEVTFVGNILTSDTASIQVTTADSFEPTAKYRLAELGISKTDLPGYTNETELILTASGRVVYRHSNNMGSVIVYDRFGIIECVFYADAQYRSRANKDMQPYGTDISTLPNVNPYYASGQTSWLYNTTDSDGVPQYTEDSSATFNPHESANIGPVTDAQLQNRFFPLSVEITAQDQCTKWLVSGSPTAIQYTRSLTDIFSDGLNVPLAYQGTVAYIESDYIDTLDPTVADYPDNALGKYSTNSYRWFNGQAVWACSEYSSTHGLYVYNNGSLNNDLKNVSYSVLPVLELGYFYNGTFYSDVSSIPERRTTIGKPGQQGFGVGVCGYNKQTIADTLGLFPMAGCDDITSDNYGNYISANGSQFVWIPLFAYRIGSTDSPHYSTYGLNSVDILDGTEFTDEADANKKGYVIPRAFIDGGELKLGVFRSKGDVTMQTINNTLVPSSVLGGTIVRLYNNSSYGSSKFSGSSGTMKDVFVLSKMFGQNYAPESIFVTALLGLISLAHAQSSNNTAYCAWYDANNVMNYPKGYTQNNRTDINDTSVTFGDYQYSGTGNPFNKTTHNGQNNGITDVAGHMWRITPGMGYFNNAHQILKETVKISDLNSTNAMDTSLYNAVSTDVFAGDEGGDHWGNGTNQVLWSDASGDKRALCGVVPKIGGNSSSGTNMFGNDALWGHDSQVRVCGGYVGNTNGAGIFARYSINWNVADGNITFAVCAYL